MKKNNEGDTPLHMSAKTIRGEIVAKKLMQSGARIDDRNHNGKKHLLI